MIKHLPHLLTVLLTCWLLAAPLAVHAKSSAGGNTAASHDASLVTEEALHLWFKEQDKVLDEILVRLSHIETLVADIQQLLARIPDYAPPPQPPARAAPPPQPAPVAVHEPASKPWFQEWMPQLAGAAALLVLILWWSRRRATRQTSQDANTLASATPSQAASAIQGAAPPLKAAPAPVATTAQPVKPAPSASIAPSSFAATPPSSQSDQALELAEIMLSMGLGSGAAQTLTEQIHNEPKQALRHWLKLLEIYRKNGQQEEFERSAEELRQHFNVQPEDWKASADTYRGLESFPHIAKRLTELWRKPDCMIYMQNLLDDNRGGARAGFPQTVAEELLLLTGILKSEDGAA